MNIKNLLLQAFNNCSTTIAKKDNSNYINDLLSQIISELKTGRYVSEQFSHFAVKDPVLREIFAPAFKDRIVQRFLINHIEEPIDKQFYEYNCGNRKNKGGHYAIKNITKWIKNKNLKYYLQIDIQSFFRNIDHNILWKAIEPKIRNITIFSQKEINLLLFLTKHFIYQDIFTPEPLIKGSKKLLQQIPKHKSILTQRNGKGLPIGCLTSQFFANIYLDSLDKYIKHSLKIKHYIRYVDDMIILNNDKQHLEIWEKQINLFLQKKLEISLHPKKTKLQPIHNGINFLGYIIRPHYSLIRKRTIKNFKQKLYFFNHLLSPTEFPNPIVPVKNELSYLYKLKMITVPIAPTAHILQMMLSTINTYYGLMNHANTHKLRWSLYHNNFKELKKYFKQVSFFETDKNNVQHEKSMIYIKPYFLQIKEL